MEQKQQPEQTAGDQRASRSGDTKSMSVSD
jgi:hypothetical protein